MTAQLHLDFTSAVDGTIHFVIARPLALDDTGAKADRFVLWDGGGICSDRKVEVLCDKLRIVIESPVVVAEPVHRCRIRLETDSAEHFRQRIVFRVKENGNEISWFLFLDGLPQ